MIFFLEERLARAIHASWREIKIEAGHPINHEVNGQPYDLSKHWHQLEEEHQDFDRRIARKLLRRLCSLSFWFR